MTSRPRLALALVLVAAFAAGCKKKSEAGKGPATGAASATAVDLGPMDPMVAEVHTGLAKYRDEMCACANIECADGVMLRLGSWLMTYQDKFQEIDAKSTPVQIEAAKKISAEHDACAKKLAGR